MGRYKVVFRKSVARDLRRIPNQDLRRILAAIESVSDEPRSPGVEKLSGQERYRVRTGDYRIIYEIKDNEVVVVIVTVIQTLGATENSVEVNWAGASPFCTAERCGTIAGGKREARHPR